MFYYKKRETASFSIKFLQIKKNLNKDYYINHIQHYKVQNTYYQNLKEALQCHQNPHD